MLMLVEINHRAGVGRNAKLCITAIMTSVFLCTVLCRERDAVWVRSINHARELCIITVLSRNGAWYRNTLYRLTEDWPVSVLTSPISASTYIYVVFSISALDQMVEIDHEVKRRLSRCQSWGLWQGEFLRLWLFPEMDQGMSTSDVYKNYVQLLNRGTMLKPRSYRLTAIHHQTTVHKKTLVIMAVRCPPHSIRI